MLVACPKGFVWPPQVLAARARAMRFNGTFAEELLFQAIRGGRLGVRFRRQVPVGGRFIADLLASDVRLVVEVDGGHHKSRRRADARRDEALNRLGYCVLRLEAGWVERELQSGVERIREVLACLRR